MIYEKNGMTPRETKRLEAANAGAACASETAEIAFVTMAENGTIDEVTATEHLSAFAEWAENVSYKIGSLRRFEDVLYRCVQPHTSQADWTPDKTPSLWAVAGDPAEEWPQWSQPVGAHDAYAKGAKVTHNGKHWQSDVDGNVWEPGTYGWTEITERSGVNG